MGSVPLFRDPGPCVHEWANSSGPRSSGKDGRTPRTGRVFIANQKLGGRKEASLSLEGQDGWVVDLSEA